MTIAEWLRSFRDRFKKEAGSEPTPLDLAHNLPSSMSDGDAMAAMVRFMSGEAEPPRRSN